MKTYSRLEYLRIFSFSCSERGWFIHLNWAHSIVEWTCSKECFTKFTTLGAADCCIVLKSIATCCSEPLRSRSIPKKSLKFWSTSLRISGLLKPQRCLQAIKLDIVMYFVFSRVIYQFLNLSFLLWLRQRGSSSHQKLLSFYVFCRVSEFFFSRVRRESSVSAGS